MPLCALLALALALGATSGPTPAPPVNVVRTTTAISDGGTLFWFADPLGNDANTCTAPFTDGGSNGPCRQIQAAINKVPKVIRHGANVTVAAGTYNGFFVTGFTCDPSLQTVTGGISIDGLAAFTNSTLATGSATGTFGSGSAGSVSTFGTGTAGSATWTTNDLTGRFITITAGTGSGQTRLISSNTGTVITIVGTWTAPDGTSSYVIQDPGVIVNATAPGPAQATSPASGNLAAARIANNSCIARSRSVALRGIRFNATAAGARGVIYDDIGGLNLDRVQLRAAQDVTLLVDSILGSEVGLASVGITDVDSYQSGATANPGIMVLNGSVSATRLLIRNDATTREALRLQSMSATVVLVNADIQASDPPVRVIAGFLDVTGSRFECSTATHTGIIVGGENSTPSLRAPQPAVAILRSASISAGAGCGVGISALGASANVDIQSLTGSPNTTAMLAWSGGNVVFTAGSVSITGGVQDIDMDSASATAARADIATGTCLMVAQKGSKVCAR